MSRTASRRPATRIQHARVGGHRIRYAVRPGDPSHTPLLFMNGLGANIELAQPFIDALHRPTVVIFDVPGVGGSPTPAAPYRPSAVARLGADLLDHLGMPQADVLGVSWGGAIAQQFALQHARRCRRLVLAATAPGALMVPARPSVLLKMLTPRRYLDHAHARRVAGDVYGGAFRRRPELVDRTCGERLEARSVADVDHRARAPPTGCLDETTGLREILLGSALILHAGELLADVRDGDVCALGRELGGDCPALSARGAGDECDLAV